MFCLFDISLVHIYTCNLNNINIVLYIINIIIYTNGNVRLDRST
jgi:hypothetical protein